MTTYSYHKTFSKTSFTEVPTPIYLSGMLLYFILYSHETSFMLLINNKYIMIHFTMLNNYTEVIKGTTPQTEIEYHYVLCT